MVVTLVFCMTGFDYVLAAAGDTCTFMDGTKMEHFGMGYLDNRYTTSVVCKDGKVQCYKNSETQDESSLPITCPAYSKIIKVPDMEEGVQERKVTKPGSLHMLPTTGLSTSGSHAQSGKVVIAVGLTAMFLSLSIIFA